jgi:hypothetical protein
MKSGVDITAVSKDQMPALTLNDFLSALKSIKKTITPAGLAEVEAWDKEFGTIGRSSPAGSPEMNAATNPLPPPPLSLANNQSKS